MKKKLLLLLLSPLSLIAQEPAVNWAGRIGGPFYDSAIAMHVDASGNFYLTGGYQTSVDFDFQSGTSIMDNIDAADAYLAKYNNNGQIQWNVRFAGNYSSFGVGVGTDSASNVYSVGSFNATVDFNPGAAVFNMTAPSQPFVYSDIYLSKLTANGSFGFAKQFTAAGVKDPRGFAVDASGNTYSAGYFNNVTTFSGSTTLTPTNGVNNPSVYDMFITKHSNTGTLTWIKQIGKGSLSQRVESIAVDASGNLYICGQFHEVTDFDPSPTNAVVLTPHTVGSMEIFVMKMDASGNLLWVKQMGGTQSNSANDLVLDSSGNIYVTGYYFGTIDFDPSAATHTLTTPTNSGYYGYVLKLDASGNFSWVKSIVGNAMGNAITVNQSGKIAVTGEFRNTCDFSGGAATVVKTAVGGSDAFVAEFNANGSLSWLKCLGGTGDDIGRDIGCDPVGNYFAFGDFTGTAAISSALDNLSVTSNGNNEAYILKIGNALNTGQFQSLNFTVSPNPAQNELHLQLPDDFGRGTFSVYTVTGQLVQTGICSSVVDVAGLAAGAYVIKLEGDGVVGQELFLKE